jgi:hypothetical protein
MESKGCETVSLMKGRESSFRYFQQSVSTQAAFRMPNEIGNFLQKVLKLRFAFIKFLKLFSTSIKSSLHFSSFQSTFF